MRAGPERCGEMSQLSSFATAGLRGQWPSNSLRGTSVIGVGVESFAVLPAC